MSPPATPCASSSPARRLREPTASTVATRSPAPASPANVAGARARAARVRVDLGEDLAGGAPGGVRAGVGRGGRGERGGVLGAAGELDADHVGGRRGVEARGAERVGDLAAEGGVGGGEDERGAAVERRARRGPGRRATPIAQRAGALGDVGGGQRAERRRRGPWRARARRRGAGCARRARRPRPAARAAGTAKQTRSWRESSSSAARSTLTARAARRRAGSARCARGARAPRPARACGSRGRPRGRRGRA